MDRPDGRECTRAFAKKSDAHRYGQAQETDAARGNYIDPKAARTTVSEWCETWLAGYETRRPSTARQARVHLKQITAEFGTMALGSVRPSHVRSWTSRLRAEDLAASYVYALHRRLAQIMGDAVHDGLIGRSHVRGGPHPARPPSARTWLPLSRSGHCMTPRRIGCAAESC